MKSKNIKRETICNCYVFMYVIFRVKRDIVAEWLRRWIANPLLFERESSYLSDVGHGGEIPYAKHLLTILKLHFGVAMIVIHQNPRAL